jgi:hypothetical protein
MQSLSNYWFYGGTPTLLPADVFSMLEKKQYVLNCVDKLSIDAVSDWAKREYQQSQLIAIAGMDSCEEDCDVCAQLNCHDEYISYNAKLLTKKWVNLHPSLNMSKEFCERLNEERAYAKLIANGDTPLAPPIPV